MTPETFLKEFGALAETEGGIKRLRELVVRLGITGRLGTSDDADRPITELLTQAAADPTWRAHERPVKIKLDPKIEALAGVVPIPKGWHECRLNDCAQLINGRAYARGELLGAGTPIIRIQNLNGGNDWYYSDLALPERQYCANGDLLFAWSASFGPYIWSGGRAIYHYHIWKIALSPALDKRFFYYVLKQLTELVRGQSHGLAMLHMTKGKMERWPILLPPLPEQKRIVKKVDELMALCDELEAKQKQKRSTAVTLNKSALNAVVTAPTTAALKSAWTRVQDHFEVLYDCPENVQDLRQTILQLAVMGKLIKQDPNDEPAEKLLERITVQQSKVALLHKTRAPAGFHHDAGGQRGPSGWALPCLGALGVFVGGGTPSKANPQYWEGDIPWVSPKDMKRLLIHDSIDHISEAAIAESSVKRIPPGAILAVVRGMILAHSFPVALTGRDVTINQDMKALVLVDVRLGPYLLMALRGLRDHVLSRIERSSHGTCRLDSDVLARLTVPLPPLSEQQRIVEKVEQLTDLCARLKLHLEQARGDGQRLMQSIVENLVA